MFSNLFWTSPLAGTDGPAGFSAGGLWARGEEGLSSSGTSVVTTSTVSTCWIGVSDGNTKKRRVSQVRNDEVLNPPRAFVSIAAHLTLASMLQCSEFSCEVSLQSLTNTSSHWPGNVHSSRFVPDQLHSFY